MTLADLSTIAGLINSIAVLVSLIYLAIQGPAAISRRPSARAARRA